MIAHTGVGMSDTVSNEISLGAMVAQVLTLKGILKSKHNSYVGQVLKMTSAAAYKKMAGDSKWEVSQLITVIESVGMSMSDFFEMYTHAVSEVHSAIFNDGRKDIPCKIYLSDNSGNKETEFSALKINDKWFVLRNEEIKDDLLSVSKKNISLIVLHPKQLEEKKQRIAVLDDDKNIVDSIKEFLNDEDYEIEAFYSTESLESRMEIEPFDAYILDWVVGNNTVFNSIRKIRHSLKANAMILVLTGKLGGVIDQEISNAIHDFDIIGPYEKPIRIRVIKSKIDKYFKVNK